MPTPERRLSVTPRWWVVCGGALSRGRSGWVGARLNRSGVGRLVPGRGWGLGPLTLIGAGPTEQPLETGDGKVLMLDDAQQRQQQTQQSFE